MDIKDLVTPSSIVSGVKAKDKKQVLQELAVAAGKHLKLPAGEIFEALLQRERLGSTGVGHGVAIPHCRLAKISELSCFFARLDQPIAFDAQDGEPVSLVFVLISPEEAGADHLKALACISRTMRDDALIKRLKSVRNSQGLYALLTDSAARPAA